MVTRYNWTSESVIAKSSKQGVSVPEDVLLARLQKSRLAGHFQVRGVLYRDRCSRLGRLNVYITARCSSNVAISGSWYRLAECCGWVLDAPNQAMQGLFRLLHTPESFLTALY